MKKLILIVLAIASVTTVAYSFGGVSSVGPVRDAGISADRPGCRPGPNCCNWMCRAS